MAQAEEFEILIENLLFSYRQLCLNEIMHEKVDGDFYNKFIPTWNIILISLEKDYLLGLAKIFEVPKRFKETISIYYFLDYKLSDYDELIERITNLRNKMFAHLDVKRMLAREEFLRENSMSINEVKSLFNIAIEIVDQIKGNFGFNQDLKQISNQISKDVRSEFDEWLKVFQKGFTKL
ncbi:MAG: hypothetical protein PHI53_01795 [Candidatus Pacebacteria bacterium]|nr:hypothetical protein [Candidatus Paceibacterota bacterium]